jgi:NADH-quinone oxidoreductase subunit L
MKTTYWTYLAGALALSGVIPLAGFWSKDEIITEASVLNPVAYWLLLIAAFLTAYYMGRQIVMVFFGEARSEPAVHATESRAIVTAPLVILAIFSIIGGFINFPSIDALTAWLGHTFNAVIPGVSVAEAAPVGFSFVVATVSTILAVGALALAWYIYRRRTEAMQRLPMNRRADDPMRLSLGPVFTLLENKYWVDELYGYLVIKPYQWFSNFLGDTLERKIWHDFLHDTILVGGFNLQAQILSGTIDLGFLDGITNFLGDGFRELAAQMRKIESGFVRNYALAIFVGVIVIIGYIILRT